MVTASEMFPSRYTKACDLPEPVVATVKVAEVEEVKDFNGKMTKKVVIYFSKKLKPLILNRTNWDTLADIADSGDSEDFVGVQVELFATTVSMNGKNYDAVRLRKPGVAEKKKKKTGSDDPSAEPEFNDEIPFK